MWKRCFIAGLASIHLAAGAAGDLTANEQDWLDAAAPVIGYARQQLLPIDVIVQPQDAPGLAPLAMAFMNGRCKLVLSMRGNPSADSTMDSIPPPLFRPIAEAIAAHEVAHCWRHMQGAWHTLPAGFIDTLPGRFEDKQFSRQAQAMRETRREEGYADLVGLAWTQQRHPEAYLQVHAWFTRAREYQPVPGSHHDTRNWIRLASDPQAFNPPGTPFQVAVSTWQAGLTEQDEDQEEGETSAE